MRVLVVESDHHAADAAIRALTSAGHEVERCHDADLGAFPCNALCDEGTCPLDDPRGIDVMLDVRAHAYPRPTAFEDGVTCALRRHVPLVVGGVTALNPYDKWTTAIARDDDVVAAVEGAADVPIEVLAAPARHEVRRLLGGASTAEVTVQRSGPALMATIDIPADADEVDGQLAVAVAGILRARNSSASRIDVAVRRPREEAAAT